MPPITVHHILICTKCRSKAGAHTAARREHFEPDCMTVRANRTGHHKGSECQSGSIRSENALIQNPGVALVGRLRECLSDQIFHAPSQSVSVLYEVSEAPCMAGCGRPCTAAFSAQGKTTYLFGDLNVADSLAPLVEFARLYAALEDGWSNASERPKALLDKTLARIPALRPDTASNTGVSV